MNSTFEPNSFFESFEVKLGALRDAEDGLLGGAPVTFFFFLRLLMSCVLKAGRYTWLFLMLFVFGL